MLLSAILCANGYCCYESEVDFYVLFLIITEMDIQKNVS